MTNGEPSLRLPKEATCDVECAMKVESLRILSKKRKQSQRVDNNTGANQNSTVSSGSGKGVKRALPGCGETGPSTLARSASYASSPDSKSPSGSVPSMPKFPSGAASPSGSAASKESQRRRFVWSEPLHQDFVAAVFDIGLKCASPKLLLEMMPVVDGLTSEHIKSHLQKYRLHRQRSREEFLKSYGYLTDLDGGKGLGGGSAAAAIKAAAAAAVDMKGSIDIKGAIPRCAPDIAEDGGCGASCACEGGAQSSSDGGEGGDNEQSEITSNGAAIRVTDGDGSDSNGLPKRSPEMASGESTHSSKPCDNRCGAAIRGSAGIDAGDRAKSCRTGVVGQVVTNQNQTNTDAVQVVASGLLQSHLELLAKGIDMQIQFHHHLREVVDSQRALQTQLLGQQGGANNLPPYARDVTSPTLAVTAGMVRGAMNISSASTAGRAKAAQSAHLKLPTTNGGSAATSPSIGLPGAMQVRQVDGQAKTGGIKVDGSPAQTGMQGRGMGGNVEFQRAGPEMNATRMKPGMVVTSSSSSPHVATAVAGPAAAANAWRKMTENSQRGRNGDSGPPPRFDLAALRAAVSVRPSSTAPPARPVSGIVSTAGGAARRSYVPGEYTLHTKSSDGGAGQNGRANDVALGGTTGGRNYSGHVPPSSQANPRVPANSTGHAAEPARTLAIGQDPRTLQRHMQAQMEMQRAMMEACVDQATLFGQRREWNGSAGGVAPVHVAAAGGASGGVGGDAAGAGAQGGIVGGAVGGAIGESGRAAAISRAQGADALPVQSADQGDSVGGFLPTLPTEDMFSFDWLEHGGELQQEDNVAPPRPAGENQSLFSFLME